ncbi:phospholipid transfer protein C2CD2L [Mastacembelus armatus]|uniref:C2cd2 like n=1 Tax=Mastacembelus armatus TaxID=205130 RepID=A0A3Q3MWD2_9TELE|nr:phospholipid transfer protein C2CD2L [Mastacembelus armatus]XP_026183901.1 phospholipid transfer protein C2CD2L [Mastacembelus armatus]XP_026183902.1 phospholipid transfer protein C2CD2L [Mastacembelus armatus]
MEVQDLGWLCLVGLFLASLLIVLRWLFQYWQTVLRVWRARKKAKQDRRETAWQQPHQSHVGAVWGFLMKLRSGRDGASASEAGVKSLLTSLFTFKSFSEHWQRTWVRALNEQACRQGSSIQITFDSSLQLTAASAIDSVTCTDQSARQMVLHCKCWVDTVTFPVTVTQQSPAAVSMDTYQITIAPMMAKVLVCLQEVEDEGLLVSWTLSKQPSFSLTASPCKLQRQGTEVEADLDTIKGLVEDTLFSTQPAMVLNLKTCASSPLAPMDHLSVGLNSVPQSVLVRQLLLRQLRVTLSKGQWSRSGELCCVLSLDQPPTERTTRFLPVPTNPSTSLEWSEEITLEMGPETKELRIRLLERNGKREQFLPGHAAITLDPRCKVPAGQHILSVSPGCGLAPNATITAELLHVETEEPRSTHNALPLRSSLTPTKKVDVDRTIMPDGTIVTTVTTVQSRLRLDCSPGDSPLCSPSKVEVTEKKPIIISDDRGSSSPNPSKSSRLSNGLDPVAETAIRQLTESASKVARKTPTKRSTLIISGVSKVPLSEDDCALSSGYAAAMDAAMHGNHFGLGHHKDPDETTPSDVSERPSVDDVESDTGSAGALETRSLKDHKVGFLQSGTKLLFRRRHREKDSCLSQSHEDISNMGINFAAAPNNSRKKSGSFSQRLIKRFSFRSSGKSKSKGSATNGGASSFDN